MIDSTDEDFDQTGLMVSSIIKLHRLVAIPTQLIQRELGVLPEIKVRQLKQSLKILFDLK